MAVISIDDYKPQRRFFALFAGDSGSGKSSAAASFPEPYHELDPDMRFRGIYEAKKQGLFTNSKITFAQFPRSGGWDPIDAEFTQLLIYRTMANQNRSKFPYETIGLGSFGSLERVLLNMAKGILKGQKAGNLRLNAPGDQRVVNSGVHQVIDWLKDMPCNFIGTVHIIDRWGKPVWKEEGDEYKPNVIIGEKLNLNDNLSASILSEFDDVYRFERKIVGQKEAFYVQFCTEFAKNSYGIPPGEFNITGVEFYTWFQRLIEKVKETKSFAELSKVK